MADGVGAEIGGQITGGATEGLAQTGLENAVGAAVPSPVDSLAAQASVNPHAALEGIENLPEPPVEVAQPTLGESATGAEDLATLGDQLKAGEGKVDEQPADANPTSGEGERKPIDVVFDKIDEKFNGGEDSGMLSPELQQSFEDFNDQKKDLELKLADPNTPEGQKANLQQEYDQNFKNKEWQPPQETSATPPTETARTNTPAERAMAMATGNKPSQQIEADQAWLASEDPQKPGFRIDGQPVATDGEKTADPAPDAAPDQPPTDTEALGEATPPSTETSGGSGQPPEEPPTNEGTATPPEDEGSNDKKPKEKTADSNEQNDEHDDPLKVSAEDDKSNATEGPEKATQDKNTPNLERRNELSTRILNNSATDKERVEFGKLMESTFDNGEIVAPVAEAPAGEQGDTAQDATAQEAAAKIEEEKITAASKNGDENEGFIPGLSDADLDELQNQNKMTDEERAGYKATAVHNAEVKAFSEAVDRPTDAIEGETRQEYDARKEAEPTEPSEPTTPEDVQKRMDELAEKIKNKTIEAEELQEFKDLRQGESDRKKLEKLEGMDPKDMTDEELDEMQSLRETTKAEGTTPEITDEQAQREQEFQDIIAKLLRGEEWTPEDIARLKEIDIANKIQEMGYTADQAQEEAKKIVERLKSDKPKELGVQREVREKLQQMLAYEIKVINMPTRIEALARRREALTSEIKSMESKVGTPSQNEKQLNERAKLNLKKQELNGTIAGIVNARDEVRQLDDQYQETADFVNSKLGLSKRGFVGTIASRIGTLIRSAERNAQRELDAALIGYN